MHSRTVKIGDWSFELKSVRALKVDQYGKPYTAIANCSINGNTMYIDGLLTKDDDEFNKKDFFCFYKLCQQIDIDNFSYHRFQDGQSINKVVNVFPKKKEKYAAHNSGSGQAELTSPQNTKSAMHLVK